ncbi:MAG TPA: methylthioribulose 1-phosphate dehydratase [Pirellulaceae bacterium]|nr:methylthioribulose 1-phosphate dehydratase [Pirellulaceae bacterium]
MLSAASLAPPLPCLAGWEQSIDALRETGAYFHSRGWSVGTSSNYSVVLSHQPLELIVTASGMDKGRLERCDFVRVGNDGRPTTADQPKSSAETFLHLVVAQERPEVGCILHTHSVWATLLSDLFAAEGGFNIEGYEMLKGFSGVTTHEYNAWIEIFENTQEIPVLAEQVRARLRDSQPLKHGYLIRKHGLYTWGRDVAEARRHIEIFEFLMECTARRLMLSAALPTIAGT